MNVPNLRALFTLALVLATPAAFGDELIEKVVVRNRLHNLSGRFELGAGAGFTLLSRLTDHINLTAHLAYNTSDWFAFELRGGYALTRHTGLANQIAEEFARNSSVQTATDLSDLWELQANVALGARWAPIYGKISLMAEVPVHFQAYVWLGAGGGTFRRESLVYCQQGTTTSCDVFRTDEKVGPFGAGAIGFRFFVNQKHSLKLEVRDYSFPDSYLEDINRADARAGRDTGTSAANPGLTNLVQFDLGYAFLF
ncbi:MAG: outer membrane beta-barrel domain-containing protein [Myxococcota bacterium]